MVQACLCKLCAHCWEAGAPPGLGRLEAGDCKLRLFLFFVVFVSLLCLFVQALFERCWEAVAPLFLSGREAGDWVFPLGLLRQAGQACLVFVVAESCFLGSSLCCVLQALLALSGKFLSLSCSS